MGVCRPGGLELTRYGLKKANAAPGAAMLEVGCGDGTAACCAQREFGLRVTAIDVDESAVTRARAKGIDARCADVRTADFPAGRFDLILMECVCSLIGEKELFFPRLSAMLCPGGYMILSDLHKHTCGEGFDPWDVIGWQGAEEMECVIMEDRTHDLRTFLAQAVMSCGSVDAWFEAEGGWKPSGFCRYDREMGYFLLLLRKKNA